MQQEKGFSSQAALKQACTATNRKYNDVYLSRWLDDRPSVPSDVIAWMQEQSSLFACKTAGVHVSSKKASLLASYLKSPSKKS
jgi:hypothetical protein